MADDGEYFGSTQSFPVVDMQSQPVSQEPEDELFPTQRFEPAPEPTLSQAAVGHDPDASGDDSLMMTQRFESSTHDTTGIGQFAEVDRIIANEIENLRRPPELEDEPSTFGSPFLNATQPFDVSSQPQHQETNEEEQNDSFETQQHTQPFEPQQTQPFGEQENEEEEEEYVPQMSGGFQEPQVHEYVPQTQPFETADAPASPEAEQEESFGGTQAFTEETAPSPEQQEGPASPEPSGDEISSPTTSAKKTIVESDDEQETETSGVQQEQTENPDAPQSPGSDRSAVGGLIADIFGGDDSDAEHDSDTEVRPPAPVEQQEEEEEEGPGRRVIRAPDFEWDFDVMLRKRKQEMKKQRRKKRDVVDLLSDCDEMINELIARMKEAAKEDRVSNENRKPATMKRKMLPFVVAQLRKADLLEALVDFGIMGAISEWLSPLPDKSLPALEIRVELLRVLEQFPKLDQQILKSSGVGKAVMLLYKHPRETKDNRNRAGKLISDWARPIFQLDTDYRSLSRKDREERDYEHMPQAKKRRLSMEGAGGNRGQDDDERPLRPGDKGWIGRARVPQPSTKDYVVRPKSTVEGQFRASGKSAKTSFDRKLREFKTKVKTDKKLSHAIPISIEGRKMSY